MNTHSVYTVASALLVLTFSNCGDDNPVPDYLKKTWGIQLSGFTGDFAVAADGTQTFSSTGKITVDGLGSNDITSTTIVSPMAQGGDTTLMVANLDGSDERYFLYDQVQNYITIGDYTKGVAVSKNPDNTYEVWVFNDATKKDQDVTVPNGYEALKLVEQYNGFKTISPYLLLTAFASAHSSTPEARCSSYGWPPYSTASPQAVCGIFKEFCDCAACLVLNRKGACGKCPQL